MRALLRNYPQKRNLLHHVWKQTLRQLLERSLSDARGNAGGVRRRLGKRADCCRQIREFSVEVLPCISLPMRFLLTKIWLNSSISFEDQDFACNSTVKD